MWNRSEYLRLCIECVYVSLFVCVCVLHFVIQYFKFLRRYYLQLARTHRHRHTFNGNAKSFRKSFLSFFFLLKIFKFYFVFTSAFGLMFNVSEKKRSASSFFGNRMLRKLNAANKTEYIETLTIPFQVTVHNCTATQPFMRFAVWKNDVVTLPAATSMKKKIWFSTCYKHGRSDFLILYLVYQKFVWFFFLRYGCYLYTLRWYDLNKFER